MTWELAKELAVAGYKFPSRYGTLLQNPDCDGCAVDYKGAHKAGSNCLLMEPSLEELIEACGKDFANLEREDEGPEDGGVQWIAFKTGGSGIGGTGSTPTIAAANLWLALNPPTPR